MKRIQLFEIIDQPWCPEVLRNHVTDSLQAMMTYLKLYRETKPLLEKLLGYSSSRQIVDLCSGASGPWAHLLASGFDASVILTDKYPNLTAFDALANQSNQRITYDARSIDAARVPTDLSGPRTLFTGFHHFSPDAARAVLQDAVDQRVAIGVFEFTERSIRRCLLDGITVPLATLYFAWVTTPVRLSRIAFTFGVPLVPLILTWDGLVSNCRTYSPAELKELTVSLRGPRYDWTAGQLADAESKMPISYLLGVPAG